MPNKSGLASSSAYTIGLLRACCSFDNVTLSRLATIWEQDKMNGAVGSQDQYLCAVGGFHHLRFSEHGIRDILISREVIEPLQEYLMLFDTHQYRSNASILPALVSKIGDNTKLLSQISNLVPDALKCLKSQDYNRFGQLLGESWEYKRALADTISTPMIDDAYNKALDAGALGGKLLGGGGGGFMVFFVPREQQENVKQALPEATYTPFKFEYEGSKVIYHD